MAVIMRDAIKPNLLQTLENTPVIVHAGPFGNIAHGNIVDRRRPDRHPRRRLPHHRGRLRRRHGRRALLQHQVPRLRAWCPTPPCSSPPCGRSRRTRQVQDRRRQAAAARPAGREPRRRRRRRRQPASSRSRTSRSTASRPSSRSTRSRATSHPSTHAIREIAEAIGARVAVCTHFADGGEGATDLAHAVVEACDEPSDVPVPATPTRRRSRTRSRPSPPRSTAPSGVEYYAAANTPAGQLREERVRHLPVCIAKTHLSISGDASLKGAPTGHTLNVREVRASVGAGFVYPICGDMRTMPGLGSATRRRRSSTSTSTARSWGCLMTADAAETAIEFERTPGGAVLMDGIRLRDEIVAGSASEIEAAGITAGVPGDRAGRRRQAEPDLRPHQAQEGRGGGDAVVGHRAARRRRRRPRSKTRSPRWPPIRRCTASCASSRFPPVSTPRPCSHMMPDREGCRRADRDARWAASSAASPGTSAARRSA